MVVRDLLYLYKGYQILCFDLLETEHVNQLVLKLEICRDLMFAITWFTSHVYWNIYIWYWLMFMWCNFKEHNTFLIQLFETILRFLPSKYVIITGKKQLFHLRSELLDTKWSKFIVEGNSFNSQLTGVL